MTMFESAWLDLREPYDRSTLGAQITKPLRAWSSLQETLRILDLAAGTGANLRAIAPHLSSRQAWHLIDNDPALIDLVNPRLRALAGGRGSIAVTTQVSDMVQGLPVLTEQRFDLVTASAFLDLVSESWLTDAISAIVSTTPAILFRLSYQGLIRWAPSDRDDDMVAGLINRHQKTDKGFGPALGPQAAETAQKLLKAHGYDLISACSDWQLGTDDVAMQKALLADWSGAAASMAPGNAAQIRAWANRRRRLIVAGDSHLLVGHTDFFATQGPIQT